MASRVSTWQPAARIEGVFRANLFVHRGAVYRMGTDRHHGCIVIRRSTDGGATWTEPRDADTGLLTAEGAYHTAPMPVIEHKGRLWRGFEDAMGGTQWGARYRAMMLSAAAHADLLDRASWTFSTPLARDPTWLGGTFNGWIEGNAAVTADGNVVDVLRVDTPACPEKAAIVQISADGATTSFDPATGFVDFPGGAKKFTIRHDSKTDHYWSLATPVHEVHRDAGRPGGIRNTLALVRSLDPPRWETPCILLYHSDIARHGFQYPDWLFDGNDLVAVVLTAYDDGQGGAHNSHDANYMTFHRWANFRDLTPADSVAGPPLRAVIRSAAPAPPHSVRSTRQSRWPGSRGFERQQSAGAAAQRALAPRACGQKGPDGPTAVAAARPRARS